MFREVMGGTARDSVGDDGTRVRPVTALVGWGMSRRLPKMKDRQKQERKVARLGNRA